MPPPPELVKASMKTLAQTDGTLTASPAAIKPGQQSTLTWKVTGPSGPVTIQLDGADVSRAGSRKMGPLVTTTYHLNCMAVGGFTVTLDSATVAVDTSQCIWIPHSGAAVDDMLLPTVQQLIAKRSDLQLESHWVDIDTAGVGGHLRLKVVLKDVPVGDLAIDFRVSLGVVNGRIIAAYVGFSVNFDFPSWLTWSTLGLTKLIESGIDAMIAAQLKPQLLQAIQDKLSAVSNQPGFLVTQVITLKDLVQVMACPV